MTHPYKTEVSTIWIIPNTILKAKEKFRSENHYEPVLMLLGRRIWFEIVKYKAGLDSDDGNNYWYLGMKMVPDESIVPRAIELY